MIIRKGILNSIKNYRKYKKSVLSKHQTRNKLHYNITRSYGRNNQGVITVRHKSAGRKNYTEKLILGEIHMIYMAKLLK